MARATTHKQRTHKERLRHVHGVIKHHYYKRMPDKKHHRIAIWVVFFWLRE